MSRPIWSIGNCSLFRLLDDDQLRALEKHARIRSYPKNSTIYAPTDNADGVFLVASGRVRLCSSTADGKQAILALIEPGEIFGELALLNDDGREERAETAIESSIVLLAAEQLRQLMTHSMPLTLGVTKLIGLRRVRVERRLRSLLFRCNRERLTHLLIDLAGQYGKETAEGMLISIKLSHQELASIIGATRETVTTILGDMQQTGLVKVGRQRIILVDPTRLAAEFNLPLSALTTKPPLNANSRGLPPTLDTLGKVSQT